MKATDILVEEHVVIQRVIAAVEHEETGAGIHEKYLALAEKLESEVR